MNVPNPQAAVAAPDFHAFPDANGHFGRHGGRFVAETLIGPLPELAAASDAARVDPAFIAAFEKDLKHYVGRPSPIYHAERLSREVGGAQILLKREDLNHTGAHKINNTIGQALLASRMGKTRIIAETGAGQHGVASATVADATPCWPAPVSAMIRFLPMRLASSAWPMVSLILCAPVWFRSSRLSRICAPPTSRLRRSAW